MKPAAVYLIRLLPQIRADLRPEARVRDDRRERPLCVTYGIPLTVRISRGCAKVRGHQSLMPVDLATSDLTAALERAGMLPAPAELLAQLDVACGGAGVEAD